MANQELVVICLATYKRPNYLSTALQSLMNLNFPENKALHLVVADNDPDETAKDIFQQYSSQLPFGSNYVCEKKRGIASVRNRLVTESIRLGAQYIAFFDDDEEVTSDWLVHAFQVLHEYSAHAVQGSVKYLLPANTKIWVKRGGFLKDKIRQDGEMRKSASTANIIFRVELVDEWNLRFNESFNLSGGSDSLFFQEAYARGAKIVGAKHAVTMEKVPESRVTFKWIMLRRLRNKIVEVRARKIIDGSLKTWLSFFPTTCLSLLLSLMIIPFSILFGRHVFMLCVRLVASCIGTLCGLFNFKYLEYRTIHGNQIPLEIKFILLEQFMRFAVVCFGDKSVRQWNCISFPNFRKYCSLHSYGFFAYDIVADKTRPSAWSKIKYVLAHLQDYDWVMWIDSDCVIEQPQITLDKFTSDKDIIFCIGGKHGDINTGVFLAKNSSWTKNFLLNVYQQTFLVNDKTFLLPRSFSDYKRRRKCNCNGCKYYKYEQKSFIHLLHSMQKDELEQHIEIRNPQSQNLCFQSYHDEYWDGCFIRHFPGNKEKKNYREFVQSAIVSWEKMKGGNEGATLPEYLTVKEKKLVRKAMSKDYVLAKLKLKERTNRLLHKIFGGLKQYLFS